MIDQMAKAEKEASFFTRLFMASLVIVVMLVCVNAGVTSALVAASKDTYAGSGAMFSNAAGGVIKTAPSTVALPLLAAPVLRTEQLRAVDFLTVKVASTDGPPGGYGASGTGWQKTVTYRITSVHSYDDTAITFGTDTGAPRPSPLPLDGAPPRGTPPSPPPRPAPHTHTPPSYPPHTPHTCVPSLAHLHTHTHTHTHTVPR